MEAAAASMGHTSGAYAGLAFALLGEDQSSTGTDIEVAEGYLDPTLETLEAAVANSPTDAGSADGNHP